MSPAISVIVPVHETPPAYFKECLHSLAIQSFCRVEYVLVFDGNHEELQNIASSFVLKDSRFKIFTQVHSGVSAARNYGMSVAQGDFICFVDADDLIGNNILENAFNFAKENNSDVVIWDCETFTESTNQRHSIAQDNLKNLSESERSSVLKSIISMNNPEWLSTAGPWCKLYSKKILSDIRFDTKHILRQDRIFNIKIFLKKIRISYIHQVGYFYRLHSSSSIHKFRNNFIEICAIFLDSMSELTGNLYKEGIGLEAYNSLWEAWNNHILNVANPDSLKKRTTDFINTISSNNFVSYLKQIEGYEFFPFYVKVELFLIRHKIYISFWLRILLWKLRIFFFK